MPLKLTLEDKKISLDEETDDANDLPSGDEIDVDQLVSELRAGVDRIRSALNPHGEQLSQVSRATLVSCLQMLGIKGKRQPRRPR
jgi:hypothetical protein